MHIILFLAVTVVVMIISVGVIVLCRLSDHKKRLNVYRNLIEENFRKSDICEILIQRTYNYISKYLVFQILCKAVEILSVLFSIGTFAIINTDVEKIGIEIISMIAISTVIFSIYINPKKRCAEYLHSWRKCDSIIMKFIAGEISEKDIVNALEEVEQKITSDEE